MSEENNCSFDFDVSRCEEQWQGVCKSAPYLAHLPDAITGVLYSVADGEDEDFSEAIVDKEICIKMGLGLANAIMGADLEALLKVYGESLGHGAEFMAMNIIENGGGHFDASQIVASLISFSTFSRISMDLDAQDDPGECEEETGFYHDIDMVTAKWWAERGLSALDPERAPIENVRACLDVHVQRTVFRLAQREKNSRLH